MRSEDEKKQDIQELLSALDSFFGDDEEDSSSSSSSSSTSNSKQQDLDDLNAELENILFSDDDDDEPLDFGDDFYGKEKTTEPVSNNRASYTGSSFVTEVESDKTQSEFSKQIQEMKQAKSKQTVQELIKIGRNLKAKIGKMLNDNSNDYEYIALVDGILSKYYRQFIERRVLNPSFKFSERTTNSRANGLWAASIYVSNVAVVKIFNRSYHLPSCGEDIDKFEQTIVQNIMNGKNNGNANYVSSYSIIYGMYSDYCNSALSLDSMPSKERIEAYLGSSSDESLNNGVTAQNIADSFINDSNKNMSASINNDYDEDRDFYNEKKAERFEQYVAPAFDAERVAKTFVLGNKGELVVQPSSTQNVVRLNRENYMKASMPKHEVVDKFKSRLFESRNGTSYEFKKRWSYVLESIEYQYPKKSLVTRIAIDGDTIVVNNKFIDISELIGGEYDIRLKDIVNIHALLKKFSGIQELILDLDSTECMMHEYGTTTQDVWRMFQENRQLRSLGIVQIGDTEPRFYRRENFAETAALLEQELKRKKYQMQLEHIAATKNPRIQEKSPGYRNSAWETTRIMLSNTAGKVGAEARKNEVNLFKFGGNAAMLAPIFLVGGAVSLLHLGGHSIKRLGGSIRSARNMANQFQ